jgi:hypothetical protein
MATTTSMVATVVGEPGSAEQVRSDLPQIPRRRLDTWDLLGIVGLASLMFAVERLVVVVVDTPLGRSRTIEVATAVCWGLFALGLVAKVALQRPGLRSLPRGLTAVWRDPPGPWVAFALGVVVAIPVLAVHAPVLFYDSDASRIVSAVRYVQRNGDFDYFTDTQEPVLPHVLFGPALAAGGLSAAKLLTIVTVQLLAGVIAYITFRITRLMVAAAASAIALLSITPVYERAGTLPMYPSMLVLGCLGTWLGYRAMSRRRVAWRFVVPAGVCLALAPEAQGTAQLFLAAPLLLVVFAPSVRAGARNLVALYGVVIVALIPRVIVNLAVGGTTAVTSPRADYWITKGYLLDIQRDFWHYEGISESVPTFLSELPERFLTLLGGPAWVVLGLAVAGALLCTRGRARWFVLGALGFLVLAVTAKRIPPFARYYAPFWPGMAILAGTFVAAFARRRNALARAALVVCLVGLPVAAGVAIRSGVREADAGWQTVEDRPIREMVAMIDDGKGVIGARAHQTLLSVTDDIPTWGDQFLTEEEYITYLTWPSDREVLQVLERHNIGWVLLDPIRPLENEYNDSWLLPSVGRPARHHPIIGYSDAFCRVFAQDGYVLFRVGPCRQETGLVQAGDLPEPPPELQQDPAPPSTTTSPAG